MSVALDQKLTTEHFGLGAESALNDITKLLFVSELFEKGFV